MSLVALINPFFKGVYLIKTSKNILSRASCHCNNCQVYKRMFINLKLVKWLTFVLVSTLSCFKNYKRSALPGLEIKLIFQFS